MDYSTTDDIIYRYTRRTAGNTIVGTYTVCFAGSFEKKKMHFNYS